MTGETRKFTYSQPIIRDMNEAIYPSVVAYLADGNAIDRDFVNKCLETYEATFPNALNEYRSLLPLLSAHRC